MRIEYIVMCNIVDVSIISIYIYRTVIGADLAPKKMRLREYAHPLPAYDAEA